VEEGYGPIQRPGPDTQHSGRLAFTGTAVLAESARLAAHFA